MGRSLTLTLHDGGARPLPSHWRRLIETLPPDVRDAYEERAALIEYDGGEPRRTAERRAFECVVWQGGLEGARDMASHSRAPDCSRDAKLAMIR